MVSDPPLCGDFDSLGQALEAAGHQLCDREAYVDGLDRITFGEWLALSRGVAGHLAAAGVRAGDVVALMLPPSIDYAASLGAAALLGAVTTGINTRLGPVEVGAVLRAAGPALVLRDEHQTLPSVPDGLCPVMSRDEVSKAALLSAPHELVPVAVSPRDPAVIIWTSGTTGTPKGAWFDHVGLRAAVTTAGVVSEAFDRRLVTTPFAHAGYMAKLWQQLAWGTTLVIGPQPWNAPETVRLMAVERITVVGGVPTQWAKIVDCPELRAVDLSYLRLCLSATAPAPAELVERVAEKLGCPLVVRYAMTESPSISGTDPEDPAEVQYGPVGKPQSGVEIELRDDRGAPVGRGQVGRIHVRSVCAMRGYWNAPEETAAAFDGAGWLRSGDLGHLEQLGNLILDGRADDMYIRGGYNVLPARGRAHPRQAPQRGILEGPRHRYPGNRPDRLRLCGGRRPLRSARGGRAGGVVPVAIGRLQSSRPDRIPTLASPHLDDEGRQGGPSEASREPISGGPDV